MIKILRLVIKCLMVITCVSGCNIFKDPNILIDYKRSGGLGGVEDQIKIDKNGEVWLTQKTGSSHFILAAANLKNLQTLLKGVDFEQLNTTYGPAKSGVDSIKYTLLYGQKKIQIESTYAPDSLQPIMEFVEQIIDDPGHFTNR